MQRRLLFFCCWVLFLDHCRTVNPGCSCVVFNSRYNPQGGSFSSPDYPKPYPANIDCLLYTFHASQDEIVELTFHHFDTRATYPDCARGDFLKVFLHLEQPGVNEYTPWSGLLCGGLHNVPHVLYSSGPTLIFEFHTGPAITTAVTNSTNTGFSGTFRFIDRRIFETDGQPVPNKMCDYLFVSSQFTPLHGRFYSPRYPSSYPENIRCLYQFRARNKERIRLVFEELSLQKGDISCLNRADIIKVHDGSEVTHPTIAVLCNEDAEVEVLSTGPELLVDFVANSKWPGQGFKATFQFQPVDDHLIQVADKSNSILVVPSGPATPSFKQSVIGPAVSATTSSCDMIFSSDTTKSGLIMSPGYPNPYPARTRCRYDFQGRGKERIQIIFQDFALPRLPFESDNSKKCESTDALMAFVQIDGTMEKIDSFCDEVRPRPLMSNGPKMSLEFNGLTSSRDSRGFKAVYTFTENFGITTGRQEPKYPCGFAYHSNETRNGTFTSPNYPGFYPRDTECHYFFNGEPKERVRIVFHYFDVEGIQPCNEATASDFVEFSNFMNRDRKFTRHCGQHTEFQLESDKTFFHVTFKSNGRLDGTGFNASYFFFNEVLNNTAKTPHTSAAESRGYSFAASLLVLSQLLVLLL